MSNASSSAIVGVFLVVREMHTAPKTELNQKIDQLSPKKFRVKIPNIVIRIITKRFHIFTSVRNKSISAMNPANVMRVPKPA